MKSFVWNYFDKISKESGRCKKCSKLIKTTGSSTTNLLKHLKNTHQITKETHFGSEELDHASLNNINEDLRMPQPNSTKSSTLSEFLKKPIEYYLSYLAARDGLTINQIVNSSIIREYITIKGYQMPQSNTTVMNLIIKYSKYAKSRISGIIQDLKSKNYRFSLTFDEWTNMNSRRFFNISIFTHSHCFNLGLV